MVTITNAGIVKEGRQLLDLVGLSTDDKTTDGVLNGSSFLELDTQQVSFYDQENDTWIPVGGKTTSTAQTAEEG